MITPYDMAAIMAMEPTGNPYLAAASISTRSTFEALSKWQRNRINQTKKMDTTTNTNYPAKTTGLDFTEAMAALAEGFKVRLPEWTGYWFQRGKDIAVFSRTGDILDTPNWKHYAMREDWEIVTSGLGFDFALLALKAGKSVRCGLWSEGTFITLQTPDANSKMSLPYLFGTSSHGKVPYHPDSIELFATNWEIYNIPVEDVAINMQKQPTDSTHPGLTDQSV